MIKATVFNDAACPWGYSANPAFRVLEWRYGKQIEWRLVVIGLRDEVTGPCASSSIRPAVTRLTVFRDRYRMPFTLEPKARAASTGRGCRAVVAARLLFPGSEFRVLRALQLANFTSELLLDDDAQIREALADLPGIDADAIVEQLDGPEVVEAYEGDKAEARSAAGSAVEAQGKAATTELGLVRYTAPSVIFERDGRQLVAGGWQPELAYDLCIANLDPDPHPNPPAGKCRSPARGLSGRAHNSGGRSAARLRPRLCDRPRESRAAAAETRRDRRGRSGPAWKRSTLAHDAKRRATAGRHSLSR